MSVTLRMGLSLMNGVSSLALQVLWFRMLAEQMGAGSRTLALLLSVWMLGQALGSWLMQRLPVASPRRAYGLLECLVGVGALASGWILQELTGGMGVRMGQSVCCLLPLTAGMGATFPWLCRWEGVGRKEGGGPDRIFACNVLGAVLGCVVTTWVLIPALGLSASSWITAGAKIALGAVAIAGKEPA